MDDPGNQKTFQADPVVMAQRKRELWTIVTVMLVSFCIGTTTLLALLWSLIKFIMPELGQ